MVTEKKELTSLRSYASLCYIKSTLVHRFRFKWLSIYKRICFLCGNDSCILIESNPQRIRANRILFIAEIYVYNVHIWKFSNMITFQKECVVVKLQIKLN